MNTLKNKFFEGERPLYSASDLRLENIKFYPGESPLKESRNIEAVSCEFMAKYPFWHNHDILIDKCLFTVYSRAAIWYSTNVRMTGSLVDAPKMFRKVKGLHVEHTKLPNAAECCWFCEDIEFRDVDIENGDYIFMNSKNIYLENVKLLGHYSFQSAKNVVVRNAHINSRDAFWETENVTVYDSVLIGEFLGWHSKNLRLVNCTIYGTQPLCYANGLVMENCTMIDTDLCFEHSNLEATIISDIHSVKNPMAGSIKAKSIGTVILDEYCREKGKCEILSLEEQVF